MVLFLCAGCMKDNTCKCTQTIWFDGVQDSEVKWIEDSPCESSEGEQMRPDGVHVTFKIECK